MNSYETGRRYEQKVARWIETEFAEFHPQVETNTFVRGLASIQPYEVDISVTINNGGIPRQVKRFWVECRWREHESIKRNDVMLFIHKGQDSVRYAKRNGLWHYAGLMIVSNGSFHADAVSVARHEGVACLVFGGRKVQEELGSEDWLNRPPWLGRC